ncbi:unnamed protein product, partial [Heterotrigona itama]
MIEHQEGLAKKFIKELTDNLKGKRFKEVLSFFENNNYDEIIRESSWDIVSTVSSYVTTENLKCNGDLVECCTAILNTIVEKCNPSETVLELLEQVEDPEDDIKFSIILSVLSKCLSKMDKKMRAIEWCIKPLINESRLENAGKCTILRDYLASILIFLMGKPLFYFQEAELESCLNQSLPEKIVILVSHVTGDLLSFLNIASTRSRENKSKKKNIDEENIDLKVTLFELDENISDLAYANFYFYVITKLHLWEKVPQIYDWQYIFETSIYLIVKLLQEQESIAKGLNLLEHLLIRLTRHSLTLQSLQLNIYFELFNALVKVMIYSNSVQERKKALNLFQNYIEIFDIQARYSIILYLYQTSEHSGLLSLTTGIFKTSIIECLQASPPVPYFFACKLPHGSASDLVELSDEIITSLNLLRFLFIRDEGNQTGIWNLVDKLQHEYLKPLREGIDLCKAHWKVKIKDLEEQKKTYKIFENIELEKSDAEITLTVGDEKLPAMPIPEKITFCYQAINGLDVMESFRRLWTCRVLLTNQLENDQQQSSQEHDGKENDEEYEKNIKMKILAASLKYVHDLGWSQQAISAGAESIGYPGIIHGLFPNRGADLVHYFYLTCNKELNKILEEQALAVEQSPTKKKKTLELQVRDAVETRLRMVIPYKKTWPQALALMALPPNVPLSLANLLTLVDDICYYAGDKSVDINWYTRRIVLAGIYKTTELYMLQDNSEDHQKTWNFLERRIKDATQIHTILTTTSDMALPDLNRATETAYAAFVT